MQVGGDIPPSFFVSIHGKDLDREQFTTDGAERLQSGFLGYLPQRDRQKIGFAIGMAAGPAPAIVDVVIDHQYLIPRGVHHPGRGGKMGGFILPGKAIRLL